MVHHWGASTFNSGSTKQQVRCGNVQMTSDHNVKTNKHLSQNFQACKYLVPDSVIIVIIINVIITFLLGIGFPLLKLVYTLLILQKKNSRSKNVSFASTGQVASLRKSRLSE